MRVAVVPILDSPEQQLPGGALLHDVLVSGAGAKSPSARVDDGSPPVAHQVQGWRHVRSRLCNLRPVRRRIASAGAVAG